jgi:hypothetical protein
MLKIVLSFLIVFAFHASAVATEPVHSVTVYLGKVPVVGTVTDYGSGFKDYRFSSFSERNALRKAIIQSNPGCLGYSEGKDKFGQFKLLVSCKK